MTSQGAPPGRSLHTAIWSGREMIVWGGTDGTIPFGDTFCYTPSRVLQLYQRP